jgi:flagellar hook-basal body complex protein FliE
MKLPKVVDSLEGVDEKYRVFYVEDGEKFRLDDLTIEGFVAETEVTGLRQNRDDILTEFKTFKKKYDGVDPEEFRKLREAVADDLKKKNQKSGDHDAIVKQLTDDYEKKLTNATEKSTALEKDIQRVMVDNVATAAIAKAKGNVKVLRTHVKDTCRCVQDDDGSWSVEVLGKDGRPRVSPGKASELMSIEELVAEMKESEDFAPNFEGDGATGGGAAGGRTGGSGGVVLRGDQRKDVAAYRAAKERAEKAGVEIQLQE